MVHSFRSFTRLFVVPGVALALVLTTLAFASPAQARKIRSDFFGMHDSQIANGSMPTVTHGSTRLWDTGTSWRHIETSPGHFDWSVVDRAVDNARAAGLRPMLVLGQTPQFHAKNDPDSYEAYGDGATSMPKMRAWKRYVTKVAKHFKRKVDYQVWNEPNIINYWSGSVRQMARLTAAADKAIRKAAGRRATLVSPAMPLRMRYQQKWFRKYWNAKVRRKGMAAYVDAVAVNLYPLPQDGPEAQLPLMRYVNKVLPRAAKKKPLYNTEVNFGLGGGTGEESKDYSERKQAAYVARALLLNAASRVDRVYWYAWDRLSFAQVQLAEEDRTTLTRAGKAWNEVAKWISGSNVKKCTKDRRGKGKGVYTCTARDGRRTVNRFYWKPSGRKARVTTHRTTRKITTLDGDTTRKRGRTRIRVGKTPVMVTSRR